MVITEAPPPTWSDARLAEACAKEGSSPSAFGTRAAAWRCASLSFMNAARQAGAGRNDRAQQLRASAFKTLSDAGLRLDLAVSGQHVDQNTTEGSAEQASPPLRMQAVAECTARLLFLRSNAETASAHFSERAAAQYGAACCYERAIKEFNGNRFPAGDAWVRAAEQVLVMAVVPAPWQQHDVPDRVYA